MTYCVGIMLDRGLIFASDSRTHAGVDNFASFCKMNLFERAGDRVIVLLSSGNLAGTQAVISLLRQRVAKGEQPSVLDASSMHDVALLVAEAMHEVAFRDPRQIDGESLRSNATFILGGQISGELPRLFRMYSEGNFIEASDETHYLQTGETKYGKPIIDWVITPLTGLNEAAKCVLLSFDATMRSNLSVGMPIDLICYERDSFEITMRRRFASGDSYFAVLGAQWSAHTQAAFRDLPELHW